MGLIDQTVKVKTNSKNVRHFEKLGYEIPKRISTKNGKLVCDIGCTIEVGVHDLLNGSRLLVDCSCDYCNKIIKVKYKKVIEVLNSDNPKICCMDCRPEKAKENQLRLYGVEHCMQRQEVKDKFVETNRKRLGVDYPSQSPIVREKIKQSIQDKYGVDNVSQAEWVKEKKKASTKEHYGVEYYCQSEEGKNAIKQTNLKKYGVGCGLQSKEIRDKGIQTCLEKYGVRHPMQNEEILHRAQKTFNERYGDNNPRYTKEAKQKKINTLYNNQTVACSTQQKYIGELYNMKLNYPLVYWNVDMFDEDNNLYVEFDGSGHLLCIDLGSISEEEFNRREIKRSYALKNRGYKQMRIISRHDYLPSDTILLQMLSDTKQYFKDYPEHSWINFDIDNNNVRNAEHKDGVPYDYGELRKIKKSA